jgi:hypothetical protein
MISYAELRDNVSNGKYSVIQDNPDMAVCILSKNVSDLKHRLDAAIRVSDTRYLCDESKKSQLAYIEVLKKEYEEAKADYTKEYKRCREEIAQARNRLHEDCIECFQLKDNPAVDAIMKFAYEHSDGGDIELIEYLYDLMDLFYAIEKAKKA